MCVPGILGKFLVFSVNLVFSNKTKKSKKWCEAIFRPIRQNKLEMKRSDDFTPLIPQETKNQ